MPRRVWFFVALLILAACGPEPTPLPAEFSTVNTPTPTPENAEFSETGVGVSPLFASLLGESLYPGVVVVDGASGILPEGLNLLVGLNDLQNSQMAPASAVISVQLNESVAPLDDPVVINAARALLEAFGAEAQLDVSPAPQQDISSGSLRGALANAGYPDGVVLSAYAPANLPTESLETALSLVSIDLQVSRDAAANDLSTFNLVFNAGLQAPENNIVLARIYVQYIAAEGVTVTMDSRGLPQMAP